MKKYLTIIALALASISTAHAANAECEAKAIDKNGKAMAGVVKNNFMKKCEANSSMAACETKAVDKNGKALSGAAKNSVMKKCMAGN